MLIEGSGLSKHIYIYIKKRKNLLLTQTIFKNTINLYLNVLNK